MAVTITVNRTDATQNGFIVEGTMALSGNYATGGDTVDFSTLAGIPSNSNPQGLVEIAEQPASGSTPQGYLFWLIAGSALNNWKLWIATAVGQAPTQLGAGAYPAGAVATTLQFRAFFTYGV